MADRLGFDRYLISSKYDTKLEPAMEKQYQEWLTTLPENQRSTKDYDLRGYFLAGMMGDPEIQLYNRGKDQHFIDRYKKPNHPTFSDLSMYHNQDGFVGGHWTDLGNGKWTFEAGPTNTYSKSELAKYMAEAEAGFRWCARF